MSNLTKQEALIIVANRLEDAITKSTPTSLGFSKTKEGTHHKWFVRTDGTAKWNFTHFTRPAIAIINVMRQTGEITKVVFEQLTIDSVNDIYFLTQDVLDRPNVAAIRKRILKGFDSVDDEKRDVIVSRLAELPDHVRDVVIRQMVNMLDSENLEKVFSTVPVIHS